MKSTTFFEQMSEVSAATQSEMAPGTIEAYKPRFESWTDEEFTAAMQKCCDEMNRFPTVAQIRQRRPKQHQRAIDVLDVAGLLSAPEKASERGTEELEQQIDALTDEELQALFRWYAPYDSDRDMNEDQIVRACQYSADQFKANKQSAIYRGYVRDGLLKMKARK